jgi:hypothetical protein
MQQGDFLVERGTSHAWATRSLENRAKNALCIGLDGTF